MRMLDLFSGIGGFALAASWVWGDDLDLQGFCEIDSYCQKVLKKNFPDVPIYSDITELQPEWFDDIDLLTGGFPCQDISVAGKGEGIEGERSGLWFEMLRLISGIRPRHALIENVPMLIHRGLGRVICDLASIGYDAEWQIISAADLGAPHLRKRIWIVAYPKRNGGVQQKGGDLRPSRRESIRENIDSVCSNIPTTSQAVAYPGHLRRRHHVGGDVELRGRQQAETAQRSASQPEIAGSSQESEVVADTECQDVGQEINQWSQYIRQRCEMGEVVEPIGSRDSYWLTEPNVGRVADGVPHRVDRLRGLGNAIVPQCAALIMERIKAAG